MRGLRVAPLIALVVLPLACGRSGSPYVHTMKTPIVDAEWQPSQQTGTASITGQVWLKTREGGIRACDGMPVLLLPDNAYTYELYDHEVFAAMEWGERGQLPALDPRVQRYARVEACSAQGVFSFRGLPAGRWLIFATVNWRDEPLPGRDATPRGATLNKFVTTEEGQAVRCDLTDDDRIP